MNRKRASELIVRKGEDEDFSPNEEKIHGKLHLLLDIKILRYMYISEFE